MKRIAEDNEQGRNVRPRTDEGQANSILMNYLSNISIHDAAKSGDIAALALLTQNNQNIEARDAFGSTVLYHAIDAGHTDAAMFLIYRGANPHSVTPRDDSAVHIAAKHNNFDLIDKLIKYGIDVDTRDDSGMTSFVYAVLSGNEELVEFLLNRGADVNVIYQDGPTALSSLAYEVDQNDEDFVALQKLLIKHKAYINVKDDRGSTPLHIAAYGDIGSAKRFIENGANVNSKDNEEDTAIEIFFKEGIISSSIKDISEFIKLLLCAGATYSKDKIESYRNNTPESTEVFSVFDYAKTALSYQPIPLIPLLMLSPEFVVSYSTELNKEIADNGSKALTKIFERAGLPYLPAELIKEIFKNLSVEGIGAFLSLSSQHDQQTRPLAQGEQRIVPYSLDEAERRTRETYPAKLNAKIELFTEDIEKRRAETSKGKQK